MINKSDRDIYRFPRISDLYFNVTFRCRDVNLFPVIHVNKHFFLRKKFLFRKDQSQICYADLNRKFTKKWVSFLRLRFFSNLWWWFFSKRSKIIMKNTIKISNFVSDYRKQVDIRDCCTFAEVVVSRDLTYYCAISQTGFRAYNSNCISVYQILM